MHCKQDFNFHSSSSQSSTSTNTDTPLCINQCIDTWDHFMYVRHDLCCLSGAPQSEPGPGINQVLANEYLEDSGIGSHVEDWSQLRVPRPAELSGWEGQSSKNSWAEKRGDGENVESSKGESWKNLDQDVTKTRKALASGWVNCTNDVVGQILPTSPLKRLRPFPPPLRCH